VTIRTFQPGDEIAQVGIFNEATAALPKFKPATLDDVRRRNRAADFDPGNRFFAVENEEAVGYAGFHANGRVSFPWCRTGKESWAEPLLQAVLDTMKERGLETAFAAYRDDWKAQQEFFLAHGFHKSRDMINYVVEMADMPTPAARRASAPSPFRRDDIPALLEMAPEALRTSKAADLEAHYLHNPYFRPEALFVLRDREDGSVRAVGLLIIDSSYANPMQVDPGMPCFRLGAFGAEGMQAKRIHGMFSFLARSQDANRLGLDLLGHAAYLMRQSNSERFAAQVPSDVPHLARFYQSHFRKQGSFPILERSL